jgi:hypothetical protein
MNVKFEIKGAKELSNALARLWQHDTPEALETALYREAETVITMAKERVPVDMGILKNSGFVELPVMTDDQVTVTLGFGGAAETYALYVHEGIGPAVGRPAFMPPVEPFIGWARRHGMPESAAYAIARKVGERGLPPRKYLESALLERTQQVEQAIVRAVQDAAERARRR